MVAINPQPEQTEQQDKGHIFIYFQDYGSALFDMELMAAPEQILAVAETLRLYANSAILERREQQRIQVAKPNLSSEGLAQVLKK